MTRQLGTDEVTLLDVLIDAFEKNETFDGFHVRTLPLQDEPTAVARYRVFAEEARRWKGEPRETLEASERRRVAWDDLEIRQMDRGVMVLARTRNLGDWWSESDEWSNGDPMGQLWSWLTDS